VLKRTQALPSRNDVVPGRQPPRAAQTPLHASELRAACDPATLPFRSTAELPPVDGMIGQERAAQATRFGIGMRHEGYNLFVLGPPATGKTRTMRRLLTDAAGDTATVSDWCYVHNFADPYRPVAVELPAGRGRELRTGMQRLVDECRTRVPQAFESEAFAHQKSRILEQLTTTHKDEMNALEREVTAGGFVIVRTPAGPAVAPARDGQPLGEEEFHALADAEQRRLNEAGMKLKERVDATARRMRELEREARTAHEKLVEEVATSAIRPVVQELRDRFADVAGAARYLDQVQADLIEHAGDFQRLSEGATTPPLPFLAPPTAFLDRYRVNVLVDRTGTRGAPVVTEDTPSFVNLVGRIEHHVHFGTLVTDFTLLQAGALHRANGGYLLLDAKDVLAHPGAWQALKKAIESRSVRVEEPFADLRLVSAVSLAPEPIPLDVKVVLIGTPFLYYLFYALDEDFRALFKVKVDFDDSLPRTPEFEMLIARFVGDVCRDQGLPHFTADGVAQVVEHCSRLASHQRRLTSRMGQLIDLVREAAYWAAQSGHALVERDDVARAVHEKRQRANLVEERLARLTVEGTLTIATDGEAVGQVNGIAVVALGDHAFGRPARITARTFMGEPGVVDIEREVKLGGPAHSKGVLILSGFLAGRHARKRPLAVSATLTFEQQYDEVEGDSASSAELYALLSSLAGIPLRQDLAVTGSVDQRGEVQAVGGINEKIEGFFDLCRHRGLTGSQGVLIPATNTLHLMLREDVADAVLAGRFHVHAVRTIDEGIELLSGRKAGEADAQGRYPDGTFNAAIEAVLDENVERLRRLRQSTAS
jgi:lon-related putative ATP-dependent protease